MSVATVKTRLAEIGKQIEGVRRAEAEPPRQLPPGDLPFFTVFTGPATFDWRSLGADYDQATRQYILRLYVKPKAAGLDGEVERLCQPFFERVRDAFARKPALGLGAIDTQLPGVDALLLNDSGVAVLPYAGDEFIGIEWRLQVVETFQRRYDPGE